MALAHYFVVHQLLDIRNIQVWVKLSEDDVVTSDGRLFLLRTALVPYQRTFAELVAFEQCVEECLGLFKFMGVSLLASQRLSGGVYRSYLWLLSREFLTLNKEIEDLVVLFLGV